jgi:hypothetical protein
MKSEITETDRKIDTLVAVLYGVEEVEFTIEEE